MRVFLVCGSIAKKSHTRALLRYLEGLLKEKGIETQLWDFLEKPISIAMPQFHDNPLGTPDKMAKEFILTVQQADAIILGTPLYHGSYSGVLKNALDVLPSDGFRDKPVALVAHGSGIRATTATALEHMRIVVRAIRGYTIQNQVGTFKADYAEFDDRYELISDDIKKRSLSMINELIVVATLFKDHHIVQD